MIAVDGGIREYKCFLIIHKLVFGAFGTFHFLFSFIFCFIFFRQKKNVLFTGTDRQAYKKKTTLNFIVKLGVWVCDASDGFSYYICNR